jgi:hypothetical protein
MQRLAGGGRAMIPEGAAETLHCMGVNIPAGVLTDSPNAVAVISDNARANPRDPSFDLHPSTAVSKGERGDPFTISWHSQKEVVQSLAWKSTLYIWEVPFSPSPLSISCCSIGNSFLCEAKEHVWV